MFRVAMMEGGRALCLVLLVSAIASVSSDGEAVVIGQPPAATPGPDMNVLCVSKCGTCPAVCSSPPPPPSSDAGDSSTTPPTPSSDAGDSSTTPPTPKSGGGYSTPPSPPGPGQSKGNQPSSSNYYYLFTAAGSRSSCAGGSVVVYALVLLASLVSVAAGLQ